MDRHLCLNLKTGRQDRKCLHESVAESPVAGHDILDLAVKQPVDAAAYDGITKIMERTLILREIRGGKPVPHHHIRIAVKYFIDHLACIFHRISVIAVYHNITLRLNLPEHAPDHITLALHIFMAYYGSRLSGQFYRTVTGIIIIYIHHRLRQRCLCIPHHLGDRLFLVIARDQYCYLIHSLMSQPFFSLCSIRSVIYNLFYSIILSHIVNLFLL